VNAFMVLLIFTIPILLWVASLKFNPFRSCSRYKGQQRIKGWVAKKAYHACPGQRATTSVWPSVDLRGAGRLTCGRLTWSATPIQRSPQEIRG
jgi:hypothetical protein